VSIRIHSHGTPVFDLVSRGTVRILLHGTIGNVVDMCFRTPESSPSRVCIGVPNESTAISLGLKGGGGVDSLVEVAYR